MTLDSVIKFLSTDAEDRHLLINNTHIHHH